MTNTPKNKKKQQKKSSTRLIASAVLNQFDPKSKFAESILYNLLPQTSQTQQATDLVSGTIRNRHTIDIVITKLANCPTQRIPNKILNIIRIGAYELIYCPQTVEYAIVNEAVENAKAIAGKKQTAFVNALLRKISSSIKNRNALLKNSKPTQTLPQNLEYGCLFDTDLLPDPETSLHDYLSKAFSLPKWLVTNWINEYGPENTKQLCFASNRKPSLYIRPNTLLTTADELAKKLNKANITTEIISNETLKLKSPKLITKLPGFKNGLFTVQDTTAALPAKYLKPQPQCKILDLCAAPGTKTTQLAELTNDNAQIFATDINKKRLQLVEKNFNRLKLKSIKIFKYEQLNEITSKIGKFDDILLDVPCSNSGVLARRPEVRYRISKKAIKHLAKTQFELLQKGADLIDNNGRICYTTCSIQAEENNKLIQNFLTQNPHFKLLLEKLTLPSVQHPDHDGGYLAIIIKM